MNLSTLCLSSTIGRWIDHSSSRLRPLQVTIFLQRTSIFLACMSWASIAAYTPSSKEIGRNERGHESAVFNVDGKRATIVIVVIIVGMVESLCAVGNNITMERDWVRACEPDYIVITVRIELKPIRSLLFRHRHRIRQFMP